MFHQDCAYTQAHLGIISRCLYKCKIDIYWLLILRPDSIQKLTKFRMLKFFIKPYMYKPSVPFVGHRQNAASDQGLHCLLTEYSIRI